jgi:hypothetical protein
MRRQHGSDDEMQPGEQFSQMLVIARRVAKG